ncbi:MAG: endonuclease III [Proteobacteria bacterium]|nr:endonuclease III [Pseudomonadota bacterium]
MKDRSPTKAQRRSTTVLQELQLLYPDASSELNFTNEFELVVSVVLSAQCTDKKVNEVTPILFAQYPDFPSLARARLASVEKIIRPVNYYRTKAKHLIELAKLVGEEFNGILPRTIEQLVTLPGVGRKTASVVVSELGSGHALAVDTHVFRVSQRLGLAAGKNVVDIEEDLKIRFPAEVWRTLHHCLILHGRRTCKAQRPLCNECRLAKLCPSARV